jgi:protein SCO1
MTRVLGRRALLAGVGASGLVAVTGCSGSGASPDATGRFQGAEVIPPQPRPSFTLTTTHGERFAFAEETAGKLTLFFFGYANCPDICPIHLANITQALEVRSDLKPLTTVVMASIDPTRDTPEALRRYLDGFDTTYVGLVGTDEELRGAQQALSVPPATEPDEEGLVGHATSVFGIGADDLVHVQFTGLTRQGVYVHDLEVLASS